MEEDGAELPSRFDKKAFLKLTLKKAYTILAHLGALRLPTHLKLYPATPAPGKEELPFDPVWLTTVGLVSASWHTNILALLGTALSLSNFLITCHRQARARPCLPGAFYPNIDPIFLRSPTLLKALRNFTSGHDLPTDQWQTALTPYHFIVSVPGQTAMPLLAAGFLASQMGTLVSNIGWLSSMIRPSTRTCLQTVPRRSCSALPWLAFSCKCAPSWPSHESPIVPGMRSRRPTQPLGFVTLPPSYITWAISGPFSLTGNPTQSHGTTA